MLFTVAIRKVIQLATQKTDSSITKTYTVPEIANILNISVRKAYLFCNETNEFKVLRLGKSIRIVRDSFDEWFEK